MSYQVGNQNVGFLTKRLNLCQDRNGPVFQRNGDCFLENIFDKGMQILKTITIQLNDYSVSRLVISQQKELFNKIA